MKHDLEILISQMKDPAFYAHPVSRIEHIQTHISHVFIAGRFVYKLKKPVDLGFLDFTTLDKRRYYCRQEVWLNRRLTHDVYLSVEPIRYDQGRYHFNGQGDTLEYAVVMRRLADSERLDQMLTDKRRVSAFIPPLTEALVQFYENADFGEQIDPYGTIETIEKNCRENFDQLAPYAGKLIDNSMFQIIKKVTNGFMRRCSTFFNRRIDENRIRDGHGDLRADHIYQENGVQIVDCIEFNRRFRYQDIAADIAFLIMDLEFRGHRQAALHFLQLFVEQTGDRDLMVLIDFYECYRAMVRVKVNCFRLDNMTKKDRRKDALIKETGQYLQLAYRCAVKMARPVVWVVCGMIASGKSTVARQLSSRFGIQHIRSDVLRKALFDVPADKTVSEDYGKGMYAPEATALVYGKMLLEAQKEIEKGYSVVLDATYGNRKYRDDVMAFSKNHHCYIIFIECICSEKNIRYRLGRRKEKQSVSDARIKHYEQMKASFDPLDDIPLDRHIEVRTDVELDRTMQSILTQEHDLLTLQSNVLIE